MAHALFTKTFAQEPEMTGFSPGRVNLIGEHTDYNGGDVLPTALSIGLDISLSRRSSQSLNNRTHNTSTLNIVTDTYGLAQNVALDAPASGHWTDYVVGAVRAAQEAGLVIGGIDIAIQSSLPHGAGLSSSAALIVGVLKMCRTLAGHNISDTDIARMAQTVENSYIGVPCGIMDQMAVAIATPGHALHLNTDNLSHNIISLPDHYHMAVIHSGIARKLQDGRYAERRAECEIVKRTLGRDDICRMTDAEYETLSDLEPAIFKRARHCMTEHRRTVAAAEALAQRDMAKFGHLMLESHASMRDDFENSVPQMDQLVETSITHGALGARMTGGGFGGCMVACVAIDKLQAWKDAVLGAHAGATFVC